MSDDSILLDALSSLIKGNLYKKKTGNSNPLDFEKYINFSMSKACISQDYSNASTNVYQYKEKKKKKLTIQSLSGSTFELDIDPNQSIGDLKKSIESKIGESIENQSLIYFGQLLSNDATIGQYIFNKKNSPKNLPTIHYITKLKSNGDYHIPDNFLDPYYDYDFRDIDDTGKTFKRGGLEYKRPCGWIRFALKVNGKYENDDWLDSNGTSINDSEWAVSYHGTLITNTDSIVKYGLEIGKKYNFGIGIYCTPNIETAEKYSQICKSEKTGKKYIIVFQNRVRPSAIHKASEVGGPDDYWFVPDGKDIRPYSICVKIIN